MFCLECDIPMDRKDKTGMASDGLVALLDEYYYKCPKCGNEIDEYNHI